MILKGSQRAGGTALARHLMNSADNEHVSVHEVRGFVSDDLEGAFNEAYAISRGTQTKQFLFSLSLSPPETKFVPISAFEKAISDIEMKLGLAGQPRVIVFHEKQGRRHAHCVWSRIDADRMRGINLSFFKKKLNSISRDLFIEHGWELPRGYQNQDDRDPLNFTQAEFQQAKRTEQDIRLLKKMFQDCWASSDSQGAFANALSEHGFHLAKGNRRGYVAVDLHGEVYSISRWIGIKAKEVRERLGDSESLPSVDQVTRQVSDGQSLQAFQAREDALASFASERKTLEVVRVRLVAKHRQARATLGSRHEMRQTEETKTRSSRLPKGIKAAWLRISGRYEALQHENEAEYQRGLSRDVSEFQKLIETQLQERQELEHCFGRLRHRQSVAISKLFQDMGVHPGSEEPNSRGTVEISADPKQPLVLVDETEALFTAKQVRTRPERILDIITDNQEAFNRNDIVRGLAKYISDPLRLSASTDAVLKSNKLVKIQVGAEFQCTTREIIELNAALEAQAHRLSAHRSFGVTALNISTAIQRQNAALQRSVGASLSDEQVKAIRHVLGRNQMSCVVGFAGSGKSTMLTAAQEAWTTQGYRVRGATLSGKAADSLQEASGIQSQTLASLEMSWKNGFHLLEPNDILVIDEAGMVGTRQMKRFVDEAASRGAKIVLVGDPEQLQPIKAGTPFRLISDKIGDAKLKEIRRQREEWQRQASRDFAQNKTDAALNAYADRGAIETLANSNEAISKLVQDYMVDLELRGTEASRLALAYRRRDVHALNQAIRLARKSGGELQEEKLFKTRHGPRAFAATDRILFTKNDRDLGVKNGMQGTVEKVEENKLTVRFDENFKGKSRKLTVTPKLYDAIDHGYATTIHKSQGATVDKAFVLSSQLMDRHLTYVAMSRHREEAKLYIDGSSPLSINRTQTQRSTFSPRRRR